MSYLKPLTESLTRQLRKVTTLNLSVALMAVTSLVCQSCGTTEEEVVCTDIFNQITIEVEDGSSGEFVVLDSTAVITSVSLVVREAELVYNPTIQVGGGNLNFYILASDAHISEFSEDGSKLLFLGWIENSLVVKEEFLIARDDCHIRKVTGSNKIILF
ncbi:MAG: hypothetical protein JXR03_10905 [Cyclobacteriaceae bacterium]